MSDNKVQDAMDVIHSQLETDRRAFERERLSRRQALRKFGLTAGMSAFALLSVDDLARMVGKALQQHAGDSQIANQVASELRNSGVALAKPPGGGLPGHCSPSATGAARAACCDPDPVSTWCEGYGNLKDCTACVDGTYDNWCKNYDSTPHRTQAEGACTGKFGGWPL